ncbi:hypothetical protein N0V93_003217 [Gnomoniopsis smithogilvyi]|uniref:Carbohydrate esterase family 16 protein n=1 Tax=Gnomoniopsis smithogilvyi TaxID=1191159 RepID=A0A9W9CYE0_9PEZI|nr:hypothetical protein N0V93_003217 [Gnomoniopsis smithogilvyi]
MSASFRMIAIFSAMVVYAAPAVPLATPESTRYSSMVVFGDSFSDNGNGSYRISNGTWPLVPPYHQGHFSNGPIWAQYLASNLSLPLYDYAVGGATSSNALIQGFTGPSSTLAVPAVTDQVASFLSGLSPQSTTLSSTSSDFSHPLFVIWAGANDIFFDPNISATRSYLEIQFAGSTLLAAHPNGRVLTIASPDLSRLPYGFYADELTKRQLRSFTDLLAGLLEDGARARSDVDNVDLRRLFEQFEYFAQPQMYGIAPLGKYGSCLVGTYGEGGTNGSIEQCEDVDGRVYWDEYHPTTYTHSWIARDILDALS